MIVVDASALLAALDGIGAAGESARRALVVAEQHAPHVIDLEVTSAMRSKLSRRETDEVRARAVLDDLAGYPLQRHAHVDLVPRVWELRENVTAYDAVYVALAEILGATLVTADARLARAPGPRCDIDVLAAT